MAKDTKKRDAKRERGLAQARRVESRLPVDASKLDMGNTYSSPPEFWEDREFTCKDCGVAQTWTAAQQKWWYEEAGGYFFAIATRCRECRSKERERVADARTRAGHAPVPLQPIPPPACEESELLRPDLRAPAPAEHQGEPESDPE